MRSIPVSACLLTIVFGLLAACAPTTMAKGTPPSSAIGAFQLVHTREALAHGVSYARYEHGGEIPQVAHVVTLNLADSALRFAVTPADRSGGREYTASLTTAFVERSGASLAVNASYFLPFKGGSRGGDDYFPHPDDAVDASGAALHFGQVVSPVETDIDERVNAIACFNVARVLILDGQTCPAGFPEGVAAGPRLLADGAERSYEAFGASYADKRHPRASLGLSADRKTAWIVVIDGRQKGYSMGATLHELAEFYRALGASDAMNLDGGGSTTLAADREGHAVLLNRPIHTGVPGRERPVANQIAVFAAPLSEPVEPEGGE